MCTDAATGSRPDAAQGNVSTVVLASGSRYRAELLAAVGIPCEVDPPEIDERALDDRLTEVGPEALAVELAAAKAAAVAGRHTGRFIVAADQLGVLTDAGGSWIMLRKREDPDEAVAQLMSMSGKPHRLVNGLVVTDPGGVDHRGTDVQTVRMRPFDERGAQAYVRRFRPFDTCGSYRIEDDEVLERELPGSGLVDSVDGEDRTGVVGLPIPLLLRLLAAAGYPSPPSMPTVAALQDDTRRPGQQGTRREERPHG